MQNSLNTPHHRRRPVGRGPGTSSKSASKKAAPRGAVRSRPLALVQVDDALQQARSQNAARAVQEQFSADFASKAQDPQAFHQLMSQVYGKGYDRKKAEAFRQRALKGDFAWLPKVRFLKDSDISGANGAYDKASGTIYLNEKLADQPELAAVTYAEEVGHHLDTELKSEDTAGDEGEMFRRLLGGEELSKSQIAEIRAENDKGTIVVDGKQVEVEFFLKKVKKKLKKAAKKIAKGPKSLAKSIGKGIKSAGKAIKDGFKKALNKLAQSKWVGYALTALSFVPVTSGFAMAANAALAAYRAIKNGDWAGAVIGAAGAFTGAGGVVGRVANAVVRGGQMYQAARAAGKGQWTAAMAAVAAATNNQNLANAAKVAHGVKEKDYGMILSGAAGMTGSQQLQYGAQLASAIQHRKPEQALAMLGQISGNPRLTALANGVQAVREKDVGAIIGAVEQLSPELRGAVMGQLNDLADTLPKGAGDVLRREVANRFEDSAKLLNALKQKDPTKALGALGAMTQDPRLKGLGQGVAAIRNRDPQALAAAISNLSPELRAAASAQLMKATENLPPEVRDAFKNELQSGFRNTAKLVKGVENGDVAGTLAALGDLSGSNRVKALGMGIEAVREGDVPEIVDALWQVSPELRETALRSMDQLTANMPPKVGQRLRAEVQNRFADTANLVRALDGKDPSAALAALGKIAGSKRLEAVGAGVDALRRSDVPELMRAVNSAAPELRGMLWNQLDGIADQFPPEVRQAFKQQKARRFSDVRALAEALVHKRPGAAAEALMKLGGHPDAAAVLNGIRKGDAGATVRALGNLSPQMRELALESISGYASQLPVEAQNALNTEVRKMLGARPIAATEGDRVPSANSNIVLAAAPHYAGIAVSDRQKAQNLARWRDTFNQPRADVPPSGQEQDGAIVGMDGDRPIYFDPKNDVANVPPAGQSGSGPLVIHVNGIRTDAKTHIKAMKDAARHTGQPVIGIRNMTDGMGDDVAQTNRDNKYQPKDLGDLALQSPSRINPATKALAETVMAQLKAGRPVHLMAHSQGAAITSSALHVVKSFIEGDPSQTGLAPAEQQRLREAYNNMNVETFGGATKTYPEGPNYVHFIHHQDWVVNTQGLLSGDPDTIKARSGGEKAEIRGVRRQRRRLRLVL